MIKKLFVIPIILLLIIPIFAIDMQDPSDEEGFLIKEQVEDENVNKQSQALEEDMFWYNTLGSFALLITVLIAEGLSYKNVKR